MVPSVVYWVLATTVRWSGGQGEESSALRERGEGFGLCRRTQEGDVVPLRDADVEMDNGTTHNIRQIHNSSRMARIENSSQPTSSRKGFDQHIVAVHNEQLPHFLVPGEYSHYHQQDTRIQGNGTHYHHRQSNHYHDNQPDKSLHHHHPLHRHQDLQSEFHGQS
jgi:hypothetical protein